MMTGPESLYMGADEVAAACSVSKAKAYMIIRAENEKLKAELADRRSPGNDKEKVSS